MESFNIPKKTVKTNAFLILSEEALKQRRANAAVMNKNKAKTTERIVETGDDYERQYKYTYAM